MGLTIGFDGRVVILVDELVKRADEFAALIPALLAANDTFGF